MSFDVDVERRIGNADIACRFSAEGGLTVLFGPSGAGKTSTLNMIAGLLRPDRGRIVVDGHILFDSASGIDVAVEKRRVGYVFQDPRLFPHKTVAANLLYGRRDNADTSEFDRIIDILGIGHLMERWPRTLSGGEARRVAIGRALLSDPAFLLLDEPLSSLDRPRREEIMVLIERMRDELGLPILMVTHDSEEANRLGTRTISV
ncbi:ATP-binding cassette domain-containing protein [Stakelama marina]|uniref:ATP-binding cassette domain-containing protein n=1 Tax=Stakelama marina TaxID=2826939 RepID=A0A8T4IFQ0_9SPHN|nr:ATP-binding cassette domain-containing protein [Stakelama marina]MBR0551076.1 ATP-binding cassette domain-containing protein [Stakelama marina]